MPKTNFKIHSLSPLLIVVSKNGRAVACAVALKKVQEYFPDIPSDVWLIGKASHSTQVRIKPGISIPEVWQKAFEQWKEDEVGISSGSK